MNIKPIHKAFKEYEKSCALIGMPDSFYFCAMPQSDILIHLKTQESENNDFFMMRRAVKNPGFFQGRTS